MQGLLIRALHETKAMRFALGVMLQLFFEESIHSLLVPPCVVCPELSRFRHVVRHVSDKRARHDPKCEASCAEILHPLDLVLAIAHIPFIKQRRREA